MNLDSFLNRTAPAPVESPPFLSAVEQGRGVLREGEHGSDSPPFGSHGAEQSNADSVPRTSEPALHLAQVPKGAVSPSVNITPSGIRVEYTPDPRTYWVDGVEVPSVTTVLSVLSKEALAWWGQGRGVQGVLELVERGVINSSFDWDKDCERLCVNDDFATEETIVEVLKEHKLTVNHRLEQASERGVSVHDALEVWASTGLAPNPNDFEENEKPYVEGLVKFIEDVRPEVVGYEVMVGSAQHRYAGRFDLSFNVNTACEYTARCYPKRKDLREVFPAGSVLGDLKTSKGVYDSHKLQLAAYELAAQECGYPATDRQAIIHVTAQGKYEVVFSDATPAQFLAVRNVYAALKEKE